MNKKRVLHKKAMRFGSGDMRTKHNTKKKKNKKSRCPSTIEYISRADPILRSDLIAFFAQVCRRCGLTKISHFIAIYYEDWPPCVMNLFRNYIRDGTVCDDDESTCYGEFAIDVKILLRNALRALASAAFLLNGFFFDKIFMIIY